MHPDSLEGFLDEGAIVLNLVYPNEGSRTDALTAMKNLAEACVRAKVSRLVHVSTAVVAGLTRDNLVTEESRCKPRNIYEETKLSIERVLAAGLTGRCELAVLRPTCVFGEGGSNLLKLLGELRNDSVLIRHVKKFLLQHRRLHLVCVDNVVEAIWHLAQIKLEASGQCFIVSEDDVPGNNYGNVADILEEELCIRPSFSVSIALPSWLLPSLFSAMGRSQTNPNQVYSCQRLLETGYRRKIQFIEGLKKFARFYKTQKLTGLA